jgi:hypothetical protein
MEISQVHIQFSVSWIDKCPYSEDIWNEIKALFFLMELGATIQNMSVVIESNTKVMKLLHRISELKMWKLRFKNPQVCKDTIGNLHILPSDVLQIIGDKII